MEIIADLHLHSKYSRATSKNMDIDRVELYAKKKGLDLITTGDFTHPLWLKEIKEKLVDDGRGILYSKNNTPFMLTTEISLIYTKSSRQRRVHLLIFSPSLEHVDQIVEVLQKRGRIDYDGRPIFGFSCVELLDLMLNIDKRILVIPAHCMTPWYGIFGSKSGFDTLKEAFEDKTRFIYAVESGLSASPDMLWRLPEVRKINIVSFSDSHSYWTYRLGREATIFRVKELSYNAIYEAIRDKQGKNQIVSTIEVDPAYGKYHWDGHRVCGVKFPPDESIKLNKICPKCRQLLTIGVEHRIEEISDMPKGFKPKDAKPFYKLLPLHEIIANFYNQGLHSKKVAMIFEKLINYFGSEFNVLLKADFLELRKIVDEKLADIIIRNRNGNIKVDPGYDGVYGKMVIEEKQKKLF